MIPPCKHVSARLVQEDQANLFGLAPDYKAGDVLQVEQHHLPLVAQGDELRPLLRRVAKEHAVVGQHAHLHPVDLRKSREERGAVQRLELVEARAVHQPRHHLPSDAAG